LLVPFKTCESFGAGAPIAGSAVDKIDKVVGYVRPFGMTASNPIWETSCSHPKVREAEGLS